MSRDHGLVRTKLTGIGHTGSSLLENTTLVGVEDGDVRICDDHVCLVEPFICSVERLDIDC